MEILFEIFTRIFLQLSFAAEKPAYEKYSLTFSLLLLIYHPIQLWNSIILRSILWFKISLDAIRITNTDLDMRLAIESRTWVRRLPFSKHTSHRIILR